MARRGYWGDIVISPYLSFGVESANKELFKTVNDRHTKVSGIVVVLYCSWLDLQYHHWISLNKCRFDGELLVSP